MQVNVILGWRNFWQSVYKSQPNKNVASPQLAFLQFCFFMVAKIPPQGHICTELWTQAVDCRHPAILLWPIDCVSGRWSAGFFPFSVQRSLLWAGTKDDVIVDQSCTALSIWTPVGWVSLLSLLLQASQTCEFLQCSMYTSKGWQQNSSSCSQRLPSLASELCVQVKEERMSCSTSSFKDFTVFFCIEV